MAKDQIFYQMDNASDWQKAGEGVERKVFGHNGKLMMVKVRFAQGAIGTLHSHPHIQVSYVAAGKFELTIDGETKVLDEGDGYFVPEDLPHSCSCLEAGILIDVFTPQRDDFL